MESIQKSIWKKYRKNIEKVEKSRENVWEKGKFSCGSADITFEETLCLGTKK